MSTHKHIDRICAVVIVLTLLLTVLFMNGASLGLQTVIDEDAEGHSDSVYFTANDQDGDWDSSNATVITLNGDSGTISGNGAYFYDGNVYITGGGTYVLSGTLTDGSVVVDAYASSKVWILLSGVDITCSDDACIRIDEADKVFLTLAEGTENTLQSGTEYSETALADGTDGVIFAHEDLTINGSGSLTVTGGWKHGISANDDLVITGGTITVEAVTDAIRANDSLRIKDADITVTAGDDGIAVAKEDSYLYIESGTIHITSGDDGIHTAGDITIAGGAFTIAAGDDGIHSDTAIDISGGAILITECYEGIEAVYIDIAGGDITIYPSDDGLNANGGSQMGGPGRMQNGTDTAADQSTEDEDELACIRITGGTLTVINETGRDADGIDSNGDIYITGGAIWVSLLGDGSNCTLDYGSENGGVCQISGGTIIACGGSSMAEGFDSGSSQCSILYNLTDSCDAGTAVSLTDADGTVLLTWDVPCSFSSVVISCPEMELGETYQLLTGDTAETVALEEAATSLGSVQAGMFGGMFARSDGEQPDMSQMLQKEDGEQPDMSQMPQKEDGEQPDMSQMPQMEDGEMPDMSEMGTRPGMDPSSGHGSGGRSFGGTSDGECPQRGEGDVWQQTGEDTPGVQAEDETDASVLDWADGAVWITVGTCALVLLAGLAISLFIKH